MTTPPDSQPVLVVRSRATVSAEVVAALAAMHPPVRLLVSDAPHDVIGDVPCAGS